MKHPMQPIELADGIPRFKRNAIVDFLAMEFGLNELAAMDFPKEDWEQLAQLIGYSLSGFSSLSYVTDEAYETAEDAQREGRVRQMRGGGATPASKPPLKKRIGAWALDWLQRHGYIDEQG